MFVEDRSILDEKALDPQVLRVVRATNFKAYRDRNGGVFFGFDMGDGSFLQVQPLKSIGAGAKDAAWRASRVDADGRGIQCTPSLDMHDAMVQTFKLPAPFYDYGNGKETLEIQVEDEIEAKAYLAEALVAPSRAEPVMAM